VKWELFFQIIAILMAVMGIVVPIYIVVMASIRLKGIDDRIESIDNRTARLETKVSDNIDRIAQEIDEIWGVLNDDEATG
jgi:hypothetical protein